MLIYTVTGAKIFQFDDKASALDMTNLRARCWCRQCYVNAFFASTVSSYR